MRKVVCTASPKIKKEITGSTRGRITDLEARIDEIDARLSDPYIDPVLFEDLSMERAELEDELNFAWQDDEAEWDYARQRQEFNPDGSLKGYGDDEIYSSEYADGNDVYVVKIWHEVECNAEDCYGPEAAEEIIQVVANSPDQAKERAKMQWSGPIDRIEIVDINPEDSDIDEPFMASTDVTAATDENVKLQVMFDPYERYGSNEKTRTATVSGADLLDALKKMVDRMQLYITSDDIDEEGYSAEDVIERIESENGDGCDYIYYIKDMKTGNILLQGDYTGEDEDWDEED